MALQETLIEQPTLLQRSQFVSDRQAVPKRPGVYAWFFQGLEDLVNGHAVVRKDGMSLLYIGICPSKSSRSRQGHLHHRLTRHFGLDAPGIQGSTLRFSLAVWLGYQVYKVPSGRKTLGKRGERALSDWMEKNAFVAWVEREKPWEDEDELLGNLGPMLLLNLKENPRNPMKGELERLRAEALSGAPKIGSPREV